MEKLIFTKFYDFLNSTSLCTLIVYLPFLVFLSSCSQSKSNSIELEVKNYQGSIDSILTNSIELQKQQVSTDIKIFIEEGKDTFELAKQKVILNSIAFKVASRYNLLDSALMQYKNGKIDKQHLENTLTNAITDVDSLLTNSPIFN